MFFFLQNLSNSQRGKLKELKLLQLAFLVIFLVALMMTTSYIHSHRDAVRTERRKLNSKLVFNLVLSLLSKADGADLWIC
jgi:hypothetical protein